MSVGTALRLTRGALAMRISHCARSAVRRLPDMDEAENRWTVKRRTMAKVNIRGMQGRKMTKRIERERERKRCLKDEA